MVTAIGSYSFLNGTHGAIATVCMCVCGGGGMLVKITAIRAVWSAVIDECVHLQYAACQRSESKQKKRERMNMQTEDKHS